MEGSSFASTITWVSNFWHWLKSSIDSSVFHHRYVPNIPGVVASDNSKSCVDFSSKNSNKRLTHESFEVFARGMPNNPEEEKHKSVCGRLSNLTKVFVRSHFSKNRLVFAAIIPVSVKNRRRVAVLRGDGFGDFFVLVRHNGEGFFIMETLNDNIDDFGAQIYEYKRIQHVIDADR